MSMANTRPKSRAGAKRKLTRAEKKEIAAVIQAAKGDGKPHTAQQSIPYLQMYPDGICRVTEKKYSKSIVFEDINYQLAQADDKTAIFENWCDFLNYFDASVSVQLSFINQGARQEHAQAAIEIPTQDDAFNSIRKEYADMLKTQLEKGNNGLEKCKYITFAIEADNLAAAKARLSRIETDVLNNFKVLGVAARPMDGQERLGVLHGIFHPEGEPFRFSFDWLAPSGLSTKDFIAPSSFRFGEGRYFRMGRKLGAVSFLEILAPELNDRLLSDILDLENGIIVNLHVKSIDQSEAIKTIKRKITDLDKMKIEEQKKAVRSGYDMDYGLDTSDYSFGYVAGWSAGRELSELKSSLETIRSTAAEIINSIDEHIAELQKDKVQEQSTEQEAAYRLADGGYLYVQTRDTGYDYTLYDSSLLELDGGQLDNPDLSMAAARDEILALHELSREHIEELPVTKFEQEQEAAAKKLHPAYDSSIDTERVDDAAILAYELDMLFRETYDSYEKAYPDIEEQADTITDYLIDGSTVEIKRQLNELSQLSPKASELAEKLASYEKTYVGDTFLIYQLKRGEELRDFRFEPYDRLQAAGHSVDPANYELVYTAPLKDGVTLENIFERFNIDHPKDFTGHSLSISDIVVVQKNGEHTAHYVDRGNFLKVPEFMQNRQPPLIPDEHLTGDKIQTPRGSFYLTDMSMEQMKEAGYGLHHTSDDGKFHIMGNGTRAFAVAAEQPEKGNPLKHIEDTVEQNDNSFDGIINNTPQTPTVDTLEQKVKAGETISLVDLAEAIKADKERGKTAKPEKKPSIRAQLKADKEKAQKKPPKSKSQDLERS